MAKQGGKQDTEAAPQRALRSLRIIFYGIAGFSLFTSILMLTGPLYMLQVYDRVLNSGSVPTLIALTGLILVLYIGLGMLEWVRSAVLSRAGSRFEDVLSDDTLVASIQSTLNDPGQTNDKPLRDLRTLRKFISSTAVIAMFDAPFSILFFVILFMIHPYYGILAVIGGIILIIIAFINQRMTNKAVHEAEQLEYAAQLKVREVTQNAEIIEALGLRQRVQARWRDQFDRSDAAIVSSATLLGRFVSGTKAFRLFLQSSVLGLGAYLSIIGVSTPGAMIAASIMTGRAIAPTEQLVGQWRSVTLARVAWDALLQALKLASHAKEYMELPKVRGEIRFEGVSAGAPGSTKAFLKQLNFVVDPGDVVGLIGPSASGKSTLARLLLGIWSPQNGIVRIDGADMRTWDREVLGPQMGYLPQQVDLFSGKVKDNICRFDPEASPEAVIAAAQAAGCHDMILRLPDGYDTEIGQRGAYLSAGQRQRIGLARAIYGDPAIVVMDEPNANLDSKGELALQSAIRGLKEKGTTVIVIAHRPSIVSQCNKLLMLDNGMMREYGPRDEVMSKVTPKQVKTAHVTPIRSGDAGG